MESPTWSADFETLRISVHADLTAEIVLNRPKAANALNAASWRDLQQAIELLSLRDDVRAVVLRAEGRNFCAGIDLDFFAASFSAAGDRAACPARLRLAKRQEVLQMQATFTALESFRWPVLAAVHGACVGGGVDLVCACDLRYASDDAYFTVKEVDVGITADLGTLQRLPTIVGHGVAADLCLTARRVGGQEAAQLRLVSACYPDQAALLQQVRATARQLAAKSPLALAGTKRVLLHARDHSVQEGLDYVATWNAGMLVQCSDTQEAVAAVKGRRKPNFSKL